MHDYGACMRDSDDSESDEKNDRMNEDDDESDEVNRNDDESDERDDEMNESDENCSQNRINEH